MTRTRRFLLLLLTTLTLTAAPALAASAAPAPVPASVATASIAAKACADAPEPTRPTAGLAGKVFSEPSSSTTADPFTNPGVPLSDVYGYSYKWVNYDTGCGFGAGTGANFTTGISNFGLGASDAVVGFTHGLLDLVVVPDWLSPLDQVLTSATNAVKAGFWTPWAAIILIAVAAIILWAASQSNTSQVVTSAGWALLALIATTYVMSYPVSSAQAVDKLVQSTVTISAEAVGKSAAGTGEVFGPPVPTETTQSDNPASDSLNSMFDTINRDVLYGGWLEGTLGSTTSHVATAYGPDLFRASHLTWAEAETVENDAQAGQAIIDAKKELWVETAAAVEREDSYAYQHLTGNEGGGRWSAAAVVIVTIGLLMPFLVVASVFIVFSYLVLRIFVPIAPAVGVIGLLNVTQGWVLSVLKNVGRFIVLGPLFWMGALVNLAIVNSVLSSSLTWLLKLAICLAVPIVLFKLLRPGKSVPGMGKMRRLMRMGTQAMFTRHAVSKGVGDATDNDNNAFGEQHRKTDWDRLRNSHYYGNGPVADTPPPEYRPGLASAGAPRELETAPQGRHEREAPQGVAAAGSPQQLAPSKSRELNAAKDAGPRRRRGTAPTFTALPPAAHDARTDERTLGPATSQPRFGPGAETPSAGSEASERRLAGRGRHPAITADDGQRPTRTRAAATTEAEENLAAPASTDTPPTIMRQSDPLPAGVVEANARTEDGGEVFEIWHPPTVANTGSDDEEYR